MSGLGRNILSITNGWAGQWAVRLSRLVSVRCLGLRQSCQFFKSLPKIFSPRKCLCICLPSIFLPFPLARVTHSANFTLVFSTLFTISPIPSQYFFQILIPKIVPYLQVFLILQLKASNCDRFRYLLSFSSNYSPLQIYVEVIQVYKIIPGFKLQCSRTLQYKNLISKSPLVIKSLTLHPVPWLSSGHLGFSKMADFFLILNSVRMAAADWSRNFQPCHMTMFLSSDWLGVIF